jgi:hypothetical protein
MNSWQRIWCVGTVLSLLFFGIVYPYLGASEYILMHYVSSSGIIKAVNSGECNAYMIQPLATYKEPKYSRGNGACYNAYNARINARKDTYPYIRATYDSNEVGRRIEGFFVLTEINGSLTLAGSALLYFAGVLVGRLPSDLV